YFLVASGVTRKHVTYRRARRRLPGGRSRALGPARESFGQEITGATFARCHWYGVEVNMGERDAGNRHRQNRRTECRKETSSAKMRTTPGLPQGGRLFRFGLEPDQGGDHDADRDGKAHPLEQKV